MTGFKQNLPHLQQGTSTCRQIKLLSHSLQPQKK